MTETMTDIAKLFSEDPLGMSDQKLDTIIAYFRSRKQQFNSGAMMAGKTKAPTAKEAEAVAAAGQFKLEDLGL